MDIGKAVKNLADLVLDYRTKLNLRQDDFGKLFGKSNASVSNIENGNYLDLPEHRTLNELAIKVFEIEYWELIKLLHEGGKIESPTKISEEQIIAALESIDDLDSLLNIHSALAKRLDRVRQNKI